MIVAKMATFPPRKGNLTRVLDSILPQVDRLEVYCNEYDSCPKELNRTKVEVEFGPDLGDLGKIHDPPDDSYIFLIDDDIIYPPNYVSAMKKAIDSRDKQAIVGCHGAIILQPVYNYFSDRKVFHFRQALSKDIRVNLLGTGTTAYHTDYFWIDSSEVTQKNMLDIHVAVKCQRQQKTLISIKRPIGWLKSLETKNSLWANRGKGVVQTQLINSIPRWELY